MSSVTLGMTTKGINSTSRQMSAGVTLDCKLKDPVCGLNSPVFKVQGLTKSYNNYNFCTWRGRYYWVDEIVFLTNDIQEVHCHLDPLATFKGAIDDTQALVQYADEAHWNKFIDDMRFNPEFEDPAMSQYWNLTCPWISRDYGTIIMSFMDCGGGGGVKTVAMTETAFQGMLVDLYALFNGLSDDKIFAYLGGMGSWRDNIISCIWVPILYGSVEGTPGTQIRLGAVPCSVNCKYIGYSVYLTGNGSFTFDWDALFPTRPYLKNDRWTSFQFISWLGYTAIPLEYLVTHSTIYTRVVLNVCSGDLLIKLAEDTNAEGLVFACQAGNIGIDLMNKLGSGYGMQETGLTAFGNWAKAGLSLASSAIGIGLGASSMSSGLSNISSSMSQGLTSGNWGGLGSAYDEYYRGVHQLQSSTIDTGISLTNSLDGGKQSGVSSGTVNGTCGLYMFNNATTMACFVRKTIRQFDLGGYDEFCSKYGYPCNKYLTLSSISGYCKCSGAFVSNIPGATPADIATINSFLNNGIVLEA